MHDKTTKNQIVAGFPKLTESQSFDVTSPIDKQYNCIAWAAKDMTRWWWPNKTKYWPSNLPLDVTVENFIAAFEQLGYKKSEFNLSLEEGFEKVAIYTKNSIPTHMARQLSSGKWASKLGDFWDIEHISARGVEGVLYGQVEIIMKKEVSA